MILIEITPKELVFDSSTSGKRLPPLQVLRFQSQKGASEHQKLGTNTKREGKEKELKPARETSGNGAGTEVGLKHKNVL